MFRKEILKVLVGSQAHGLATELSDFDYRSVFVTPTSELLKIGAGAYKGTSWTEGEAEDNTSYEVGHFLLLATKSNPSILEVFKAPILGDIEGQFSNDLIHLFSHVWSSVGVYNAFLGYSHDQRKKFFDDREEFAKRRGKYAVAHLRVLLSGIELLTTGNFSIKVQDFYLDNGLHLHLPDEVVDELHNQRAVKEGFNDSWREYLLAIKRQEIKIGSIVNTAEYLKSELKKAYEKNPNKQTDLERVNEFLLEVRRENW